MAEDLIADLGADRTLLLVDDDEPFVKRLAKAMEKRGFLPETAESVAAGRAIAMARPPAYAVVDLRLEDATVWTWWKPCASVGRIAGSWC